MTHARRDKRLQPTLSCSTRDCIGTGVFGGLHQRRRGWGFRACVRGVSPSFLHCAAVAVLATLFLLVVNVSASDCARDKPATANCERPSTCTSVPGSKDEHLSPEETRGAPTALLRSLERVSLKDRASSTLFTSGGEPPIATVEVAASAFPPKDKHANVLYLIMQILASPMRHNSNFQQACLRYVKDPPLGDCAEATFIHWFCRVMTSVGALTESTREDCQGMVTLMYHRLVESPQAHLSETDLYDDPIYILDDMLERVRKDAPELSNELSKEFSSVITHQDHCDVCGPTSHWYVDSSQRGGMHTKQVHLARSYKAAAASISPEVVETATAKGNTGMACAHGKRHSPIMHTHVPNILFVSGEGKYPLMDSRCTPFEEITISNTVEGVDRHAKYDLVGVLVQDRKSGVYENYTVRGSVMVSTNSSARTAESVYSAVDTKRMAILVYAKTRNDLFSLGSGVSIIEGRQPGPERRRFARRAGKGAPSKTVTTGPKFGQTRTYSNTANP